MSFLYVIESPDGLIKVGHSLRPAQRRDTLQRMSAKKLVGVAVFETDKPLTHEKSAHKFLSEFRVFGEWFKATAEQALEACKLATDKEPSEFPTTNPPKEKGRARRTGLAISLTDEEREEIAGLADAYGGLSYAKLVMLCIRKESRRLETARFIDD